MDPPGPGGVLAVRKPCAHPSIRYRIFAEMAFVRTPRHSWVEEGLRALAGGGPDRVRIEALAKQLGVTKGGFYWHFDDRPALLKEMLAAWEEMVVDEVIESVEAGGGDAREKWRRLFPAATAAGSDLIRIELAIRDWARRDEAVARRLRRVDNRRMDYLRSQISTFCPDPEETEARTLLAFTLAIGNPFVDARLHRTDVLERALRHVLR